MLPTVHLVDSSRDRGRCGARHGFKEVAGSAWRVFASVSCCFKACRVGYAPAVNTATDTKLRVLLVEDDEVDKMLIERAFQRSGVEVDLTPARDGLEALEAILGSPEREPLPRPYLVVLDLNMPRMGGIEFLDRLRSDPELRRTVVFVLTTSEHERDRAACYNHCVAGFVVKQSLATQSQALVKFLERYWQLVQLPLE